MGEVDNFKSAYLQKAKFMKAMYKLYYILRVI